MNILTAFKPRGGKKINKLIARTPLFSLADPPRIFFFVWKAPTKEGKLLASPGP